MAESDDPWRPSCYDCDRELDRRDLQPHPIHIEHDDEPGYERVDVPLCPGCRKQRMPTHACQTCGEEYVHLDRAAECCQHRQGRPMPDGGVRQSESRRVRTWLAPSLCAQLDTLVDLGYYQSRSAAIRAAVRREIRLQSDDPDDVADQLQRVYTDALGGYRPETIGGLERLAELLGIDLDREVPR